MTEINKTWTPYLEAGEKNEKELLDILKLIDKDAVKMEGNFKEYDFSMPNVKIKIELKRDFKSDETGNFAFEYECFGKKSGLACTTADYFVMTDTKAFYFFKVDSLKDFLRENWKYFKTTIGGDENASKMVLVKKGDLSSKRFCHIVFKNRIDISLLNFYLTKYQF